MASPRRSHRGGQTKGKKKEEDDDGGQTRCVCNQLHHEGVMIQCETCKVWQHCPCVGLGDGTVTPDKYYCDSCRPQNHPYKVANGILLTNVVKKMPQLPAAVESKSKPVKKRNTMNSKEASIPMDLMLAQQKWNEGDDLDAIDDSSKSTKRRKKSDSTTDEEADIKKNASASPSRQDSEHDQEETPAPSTSTNTSRTSASKKSSAKTAGRSRSNSPPSNSTDVSLENATTPNATEPSSNTTSPSKSSRPVEQEETPFAAAVVPSTKRRKTARNDLVVRNESLFLEDTEADTAQSSKKETNEDHSNALTRPSRRNGNGNRSVNKRTSHNSDQEDMEDSASTHTSHSANISQSATPTPVQRRAFPKRAGYGQAKAGSRHSTPVPQAEGSGTPQPMAPAAPASVRYPSHKMTFQEMSKRAKQLLDYISRIQVDMADRKSKKSSTVPSDAANTPTMASEDVAHAKSTHGALKEDPFTLPASAAPLSMHGDSQVCPDLSRTSMEGVMDGMHDTVSMDLREATVKLSLTDRQSPLLSTPPLSVHELSHMDGSDHRDPQHDHVPFASSTLLDSVRHEPMTPPHQPLDGTPLEASENTDKECVTSLELMDKLTGDLIRFQERFGSHC